METNNTFSFKRLELLFRQSFIINKKLIGISLAGIAGTMFFVLIILQSMNSFRNWDQKDSMLTFLFLFFSLGSIYAGLSFPAFRTKDKSISYLMLPASSSEKYIFEFLTRILAFFIIIPLIFWVVANIEGTIVHHYKAALADYKFSFQQAWAAFTNNTPIKSWNKLAIIQGGLFVFLAAFTGACHFSKSPLIKTIFTISIIISGYVLLTYLLIKGLNLKDYQPSESRILFIRTAQTDMSLFAIVATVTNLALFAISWFRFKEKEV